MEDQYLGALLGEGEYLIVTTGSLWIQSLSYWKTETGGQHCRELVPKASFVIRASAANAFVILKFLAHRCSLDICLNIQSWTHFWHLFMVSPLYPSKTGSLYIFQDCVMPWLRELHSFCSSVKLLCSDLTCQLKADAGFCRHSKTHSSSACSSSFAVYSVLFCCELNLLQHLSLLYTFTWFH